jgi:hypothetical protein
LRIEKLALFPGSSLTNAKAGFLVSAAPSRTLSMARKVLGNARKRSSQLRLRVARTLCEIPSGFLKGCILREGVIELRTMRT